MSKRFDTVPQRGRAVRFGSGIVVFIVMAGFGCERPQGETETATSDDPVIAALNRIPHHPHRSVCSEVMPAGHVRCFARVRTNENAAIMNFATPQGFGPADLTAAYNLPSTGGAGITVAIVDAFDNPNAESDLA